MRPLVFGVVTFAAAALAATLPAQSAFYPLSDVKPGQVGIGRTIFAGDTIEEFKVNILGVLHNVIGPQRDLILAKLEGGPLATTGVIQGMSGSPVYIDGRLVGAVSYALGSFPREPFAGITPIARDDRGRERRRHAHGRQRARTHVARDLGRGLCVSRTSSPSAPLRPCARPDRKSASSARPRSRTWCRRCGRLAPPWCSVASSPASIATCDRPLLPRAQRPPRSRVPAERPTPPPSFAPGDAVGVSLIRGDLEMGATGTVTYVDGSSVYAFGHPFLNLGPTSFAMTRAHVYTVLPSLDSSLKIASLGPVIGTMNQDRATAIGGTIGAPPRELAVTINLVGNRGPDRKFTFYVLHDQMLTPLFSYVAILNALTSYRAPGRRDVDRRDRQHLVWRRRQGRDRRRVHRRERAVQRGGDADRADRRRDHERVSAA